MHDPTEPLAWVARAEEDLALAQSALRLSLDVREVRVCEVERLETSWRSVTAFARGELCLR